MDNINEWAINIRDLSLSGAALATKPDDSTSQGRLIVFHRSERCGQGDAVASSPAAASRTIFVDLGDDTPPQTG